MLVTCRPMEESSRNFPGVQVRRVVDHSHRVVAEHAHDWPVLSLFVLGGYRNRTERGEVAIEGPSALLYRAGAAHRNGIGPAGFEQIEIEFDPDWLGRGVLPDAPVSLWRDGWAAGRARGLARDCLAATDEASLKQLLRDFILSAVLSPSNVRPAWMRRVEQRLRAEPGLGVRQLAVEVGRHPAWLGSAYRRASGEAPSEAAARFRVETAARLLRETAEAPAQIALAAGFCDQSHMIRTFRRLLGRSPSLVRADAARLRGGRCS